MYTLGKIKFMSETKENPHSTNVYSDITREIEDGKEPPEHRGDKRVNSTTRDEPNDENIPPNLETENKDLHSRTSYNQQAIASKGAGNPSLSLTTTNENKVVVEIFHQT